MPGIRVLTLNNGPAGIYLTSRMRRTSLLCRWAAARGKNVYVAAAAAHKKAWAHGISLLWGHCLCGTGVISALFHCEILICVRGNIILSGSTFNSQYYSPCCVFQMCNLPCLRITMALIGLANKFISIQFEAKSSRAVTIKPPDWQATTRGSNIQY